MLNSLKKIHCLELWELKIFKKKKFSGLLRGLFNLTDVDFRLAPKLGKSDDKNYSGHDFLIAVFLKARYISLGMHSLRWI